MPKAPSVLIVAALLLVAAGGAGDRAAGADPPALACSSDTPTVPFGGAVTLRVWTTAPAARLEWEAVAGQLDAHGPVARWSLAGLQPGAYAAIARVGTTGDGSTECVVRVVVRRDAGTRGPDNPGAPGPVPRETGSALLVAGRQEATGYGLYSYLLLGAPPPAAARPRVLAAIDAYWRLVPDVASLERYLAPAQLNIAYMPVTGVPAQAATTDWLLDKHDYARSRSLLRILPGTLRDGPYILSVLKPPGPAEALTGPYLLQDLSAVPPNLAAEWVREFLNQAAQERFWEGRTAERLALKLRLTVGIMGAGLPEVKKALDSWIAWVR